MPKKAMPPHGSLSREVAKLLEATADELSISDTALARLVGISQPQMSIYMRGERSLTIDILDRICSVMGLSITKVIEVADEARKP